jgi:small-conductance mechanosensitive channel/CRP-like cAMP-binding protein
MISLAVVRFFHGLTGWLDSQGLLEEYESLEAALILTLVTGLVLPPPRWKQLRGPILFFVLFVVVALTPELLPAIKPSPLGPILEALATFFLLVGMGRLGLLFVVRGCLERFGRPLPKISVDLIQMLLILGTLLVVIHQSGVAAPTLFTGSAVITAVLGFALRDTLGNLFAGLALQIEAPFEVGDWIQYDANAYHIGKVLEINWRATKVLTLDQVEVILPNGQLANTYIRNFTKPYGWSRRSLYVIVPYDVPPNRVQRLILDALPGSYGVLEHPPPSVVTYNFTDRGVEYWVRFFTFEFGSRDRVDGEARDRIWYALTRVGIAIPVATHAVRMTPMPTPTVESPESIVTQRAARLRRVDVLAMLPDAALEQIAAQTRVQLFAAGEAIIRQGEVGATVYLLEAGEVRVTARLGENAEVEVARLSPGAFFGEMSLLTGSPRSATVTAVTECRVLAVDKTALEPILRAHPELIEGISRTLAERRSLLNSRLEDSAVPPVEVKNDLFAKIREFFSLG